MKKVVLAYSGGLDTSYCIKYLTVEQQMEVHAVLVNTGGFAQSEIEAVRVRALDLGASSFEALDVRQEYYTNCIRYLLYGNVLRNETYPLSVSAERMYQAMSIVEYALKMDAQAIAHGSTGAGNDQIRFDVVFQALAPHMEIITPIRDMALSRQEEIDYLKKQGVQMNWEKAKYSINQGLWGTSVGGKETLTSDQYLPEEAFPSTLSQQEPTTISITFEQGEPTMLNGTPLDPVSLIEQLNALAADYAIGRDIHVGDTIIGIKGRVGFEAGGPIILIKAHHLLEKHTQSKWQLHWKQQLGNWYGMMLHESQFLDPVVEDIQRFLTSSQRHVCGTVAVELLPYRYVVKGVRSANDLMNTDFGTYGEENKAWSAEDAKGFIKVFSNQYKIFHGLHSKKEH